MKSKSSGGSESHKALLYQLTGIKAKKPHTILPVNVWRKTQRDDIETALRERIIQTSAVNASGEYKKLASIRETMVREMYGALSKENKAHWEREAKEEYTAAVAKWTRDLDAPPSTAPADRQRYVATSSYLSHSNVSASQRCIQGLVQFIQPILDLVRDSTGWTASFIAGGPEPAHEGRLNVIRWAQSSLLRQKLF